VTSGRPVDLPVFGDGGYPLAYRDAVAGEPGQRFAGMPLFSSLATSLIGGGKRRRTRRPTHRRAFVREAAVGAPAVLPDARGRGDVSLCR
jgi:hypothetical protein